MPNINNIETKEDKEFFEVLNNNRLAFRTPIKTIQLNDMVIGVYKSGKDLEFVGYKDKNINNGNAIIFCGVTIDNKFNYPLICYTEVKHSYKNKGLTTSMYDFIIDIYGGLISDDNISEPMKGVYSKLINKYNSYIINPLFKIIRKIKNDVKFNSSEECIMLSKEELDIEEWNEINESLENKSRGTKMRFKNFVKNTDTREQLLAKYKQVLKSFKHYDDDSTNDMGYFTPKSFKKFQDEFYEIKKTLQNLEIVMKEKDIDYKEVWKDLDFDYKGMDIK
jgi:hypothetical protein